MTRLSLVAARNFGYNYNGMGHVTTITESRYPNRPRFGYHEWDARATILSNYTATVNDPRRGQRRLRRALPSVARQSLACSKLGTEKHKFLLATRNASSAARPHNGRLSLRAADPCVSRRKELLARLTPMALRAKPGDTSTVNAKGSYSVINGSAPAVNATTLHSELFYHRNMTVNQNSIALSSDRGSLEIAGVSLLYEGTRVKSYLLGRDLNPAGRGLGDYYPQGMFGVGGLRPTCTPNFIAGSGNSINNMYGRCCCPRTGCVGQCSGVYSAEGCNCCLDTDNAFERCVSMCKSPAPIKVMTHCGIPDFTYRLNHKSELQKDMYYRHAFCLYMAANAACADLNCGDDKITGWGCCMGYCTQVLFGGGGGGVGGSGGGYGGTGGGGAGCGGCAIQGNGDGSRVYNMPSRSFCCKVEACAGDSQLLSSMNVDCGASSSTFIPWLSQLLRCVDCWIKGVNNNPADAKELPMINGHHLTLSDLECIRKWLMGSEGPMRCQFQNFKKYFSNYCFGRVECGGCPGSPSESYACGFIPEPPCHGGKYVLLCNTFFMGEIAGARSAYGKGCIFQMRTAHELMHMCHPGGWSHTADGNPTHGNLDSLARMLLHCCYQDCFKALRDTYA